MFDVKRKYGAHVRHTELVGVWIVALCLILPAQAQEFNNGERRLATESKTDTQSNALIRDYKQTYIPLEIVLEPITLKEEKTMLDNRSKQPMQVGFGRAVPAPYDEDIKSSLTWIPLPEGGYTAAFVITSPGARAMRLALEIPQMEKGIEIRFFDAQLEKTFGPFLVKDLSGSTKNNEINDHAATDITDSTSKKDEKPLFWSPVIEGELIGVEVYMPASADPNSFFISTPKLSHFVDAPHDINKDLSDIGRSGSCNIDVSCRNARDIEDAVAKIIFTNFWGTSYLCTGTLLNDTETDSFIDYFVTGNHCINEQSLADTINTYWFFQKSTCDGPVPTSVVQHTGGAELLYTETKADFSFLQLDDQSPVGVWYSGWDSASLAASSTVISMHHPRGDLKKWSQGSASGFSDFEGEVNDTGSHIRVIWDEGTTEKGSSGGALFDTDGYFRGNLHGGHASCSSPNLPDWYGRFDLPYPSVSRWLYLNPETLISGTAVTNSVQNKDSKEYKITSTSDRSELIVELSELSQDADLYVRRGNRPTLDSYDCRPYGWSSTPETCTFTNPGNYTYYIRVRGDSSGSTAFTIRASLL